MRVAVSITCRNSRVISACFANALLSQLCYHERGLCTHFQLILLARPNRRNQRTGEKPLSDPRVHMITREDLLDFIDTLDSEKFVAAVVHNGQRARKENNE